MEGVREKIFTVIDTVTLEHVHDRRKGFPKRKYFSLYMFIFEISKCPFGVIVLFFFAWQILEFAQHESLNYWRGVTFHSSFHWSVALSSV